MVAKKSTFSYKLNANYFAKALDVHAQFLEETWEVFQETKSAIAIASPKFENDYSCAAKSEYTLSTGRFAKSHR